MNSSTAILTLTKSRIDKGLLAIPRKYCDMFPNFSTDLTVYLDGVPEQKLFTPKDSTAKEARIYGMHEWFSSHCLQTGGRILVEKLEQSPWTYRIVQIHHP